MIGQKKRLGRVEVVEEDLADRLLLLLLVALRLDALLLDYSLYKHLITQDQGGKTYAAPGGGGSWRRG